MNLQSKYEILIVEAHGGGFYASLTANDNFLWLGSLRENERDAMIEATCFLTSQYQKPKET